MTGAMPNLKRRWVIPLAFLAVIALAWGGGFAWFLRTIAAPAVDPVHADGIVVLTGGAERIDEGLHLLADGRANRLLISGIGGKGELSLLARGSAVDTASLAGRVTLGRMATSTHGNALETAAWVRENGIGSLIVVTAWYHMPRALTELRRVMPKVALVPVMLDAVGVEANGPPVVVNEPTGDE